jgi:DNA-binding MarR family transcriptional regulator
MATNQPEAVDHDLVTRTRLAVLRLARRLRQQVTPGITPSQQSALAAIEHRGPLTLGELAAYENVQPPSITRIVGNLEAAELVERTTATADRRVSLVQITGQGRAELQTIRTQRDAWLAGQLATLEPDELQRVRAALPVLDKILGLEDAAADPPPSASGTGSASTAGQPAPSSARD